MVVLAPMGLVVLAMWALGGWEVPLPSLPPAIRTAAGVLPARWAFEGLLLLETSARPARAAAAGASPVVHDLAEDYFPSETQRMGVPADVTALGAMLVGLAASAVVISGGRAGR